MFNNQLRKSSVWVLGATIAALSAQVAAQSAVLEEIVVTAQKRAENLQEVPVSVTAFSAANLESRSMFNLGNLSSFTPNVDINHGKGDGGSTNAAVFIRGVGQNDFIFPTDPGVGIYLDGVYIARSIGGMLDLADVERIEVLRGPQGTLYGKNTIGGAINVVTSRPSGETSGRVKVTFGERDRQDLEANLSLPLIDNKLYAKLALASKNQDGFSERVSSNLDLGDTNVDAARLGLNWILSEDVSLYLSADASRIRQNGAPGTLLETFDAPGGLYGLYNGLAAPFVGAQLGLPPGSLFDDRWVTGDTDKSNGTGPTEDENDTWGVIATLDWEINENVSFKSITAYREMEATIRTDIDYSPFPIIHTDEEQDQEQFSQEFQLSGDSGKLHWLVGAYYLTEDISDLNTTLLASGIFDTLNVLPAAVVPLVPGVVCPAAPPAPCAGGAGNPLNAALDLDVRPYTSLDTTNWATFVHLSYALTEQLSLTLGGRYSYEEKEYFIDSVFPNSGNIATPPTKDTQDWSKFTPKIGVDFQVNEDLMVYGSITQGQKSGGWNPRPLQPAEFKRYDQEELTAYEIGLKSKLLDGRMTLNIAAFYSEYEDLQLFANTINPTNGSLLLTVDNAGDVDLYGFEIEIVARPTANLDINFGAGYLENEYQSLSPNTGYSENNELPQAPKWTLNGGVQYRFDLDEALGSITVRGDVSYRSKTYNDPQNTKAIVQSGYGVVNARISWISPAETWQSSLFVTNLNDKEYFTSAESIPAFGIRNAVYGRPREWGVSLSYHF